MLENIIAFIACWSMLGFMGVVLAGMEAAHESYPPKKIPLWKECLYIFLSGPVCWVIFGIMSLHDWIKGEG